MRVRFFPLFPSLGVDEFMVSFWVGADRYCPGGPDSDFDYSTQSYTGYEPTSMRAIRARYDPYEQTRGRVEQLKSLGHNVDKVRNFAFCSSLGAWTEDDLGRVHRYGRDVHEYAGRLPGKVYCSAA